MEKNTHKPMLAVLFSILFPGLGQFYNQETKKAIMFFLSSAVAYSIFVPIAIFIMFVAAIDAYRKAIILKRSGFVSKNIQYSIFILIALFMFGALMGFFAPDLVKILTKLMGN